MNRKEKGLNKKKQKIDNEIIAVPFINKLKRPV